jgi:lipoprotein NlpD
MSPPALLLALLLLLLASGCSSNGVKAPHESRTPFRGGSSPGIHGAAYIVQPGDTLGSVALRSGISAAQIAAWNALPPPYHLRSGQRLRLRPAAAAAGAASGRTSADADTATKAAAAEAKSSPPPRPAERALTAAASPQPVEGSDEARRIREAVMAKMERQSPRHRFPPDDKLRWKWPVRGRVVSSFRAADPSTRGILIGGKEGTTVAAAESGEVVYSDDGLKGYGELIIIKHNQNYLSVYAHNRKRLVSEGEWVARGAPIAIMGRHHGKTVLHFGIRHQGEPQDPLKYLP